MNTNILRQEIQTLLETIGEQYEVIRNHEEKIPQIEFDILMENVRKLYDKLYLLNKSSETSGLPDTQKPELPEKPPVNEQTQDPPLIRFQSEETNGTPPKQSPPAREDELDLFASGLTGFPGKLQEARQQSLGPRTKKTGPQDLKTFITINEKFLFINELFDGNLREYNENIESLAKSADLKTAMDLLDVMRKKNLWNSESIAFNKLKEILERKFR